MQPKKNSTGTTTEGPDKTPPRRTDETGPKAARRVVYKLVS